jgi:hypothetical protein
MVRIMAADGGVNEAMVFAAKRISGLRPRPTGPAEPLPSRLDGDQDHPALAMD